MSCIDEVYILVFATLKFHSRLFYSPFFAFASTITPQCTRLSPTVLVHEVRPLFYLLHDYCRSLCNECSPAMVSKISEYCCFFFKISAKVLNVAPCVCYVCYYTVCTLYGCVAHVEHICICSDLNHREPLIEGCHHP